VLLKPFAYEPARHLYKLIRNPDYRSWCALDTLLGAAPRFEERSAATHGWSIVMPDAASFLSAYREIFVNRIYEFRSDSPRPRILDIGANIGVSVLFFKLFYPGARITAYEPDPKIFSYLKRNVHGNGFTDVELVNKAVWDGAGSLSFHADGADGGRITRPGEALDAIEIETVDVRTLLQGGKIDFVKIDIEGAETTVVRAAAPHLADVRSIFVEYHSDVGREQDLAELIGLLTHAGFRLDVQNLSIGARPLMQTSAPSGFDLQLNIFGRRIQR
jgi:FkbM family methyltransferase